MVVLADTVSTSPRPTPESPMPTLFRFLMAIAVIGGIIYGAIFALATLVEPKSREISVIVPPDKFLKK
jgi:hypothetical protein